MDTKRIWELIKIIFLSLVCIVLAIYTLNINKRLNELTASYEKCQTENINLKQENDMDVIFYYTMGSGKCISEKTKLGRSWVCPESAFKEPKDIYKH